MNKRAARLVLVTCALVALLQSCASTPPRNPESGAPEIVVRNYHAALNRGDLLPLTLYVAPDVEWYSVVNGERILEVSGRQALTEALRAYFARNLKPTWSFDSAFTSGSFIAVRERSQWRGAEGSSERTTLCVYELHDGRIRRITQFLTGE